MLYEANLTLVSVSSSDFSTYVDKSGLLAINALLEEFVSVQFAFTWAAGIVGLFRINAFDEDLSHSNPIEFVQQVL